MDRLISQETFDIAVKENIEDFGMGSQDAIEDAIKQFISQGVSLDSIDTSGGVDVDEVKACIATVSSMSSTTSTLTVENVECFITCLERLEGFCGDGNKYYKRNINMIYRDCFNSIFLVFNVSCPFPRVIDAVIKLLIVLTSNSGEHQPIHFFMNLRINFYSHNFSLSFVSRLF